MENQRRGVALIILAYALLAAEMIAIHRIGGAAGVLQIALLRSVGNAFLVAILARNIGWRVFRTQVPGLQIFRSFLSLLGFWAFIYAFGQLPLLDATALTYTQALFVTGFAALLLGESVRSLRWVASLIGLCGAMFVIRPAFTAWDAAYLVALAAPFFNAAALTATKFLEQRDSSLTIMAWLTAIYLLCSSPALLDWQELPASLWFWVIAVMILGPLGTYLRILAIRAADMSVLAPYDYVRLVINGCFALVLFHEIPDPLSVVGAAMIVAGCVLVVLPARWIPILVGRTVVRLRSG